MVIFFYILFFYAIFGFLVAGGLFFNKSNNANIFLAIYTFLFSLSQLFFIYNTTEMVHYYPKFRAILYPVWLLYGPSLWLYLKYFIGGKKFYWKKEIFHLIPFVFLVGFTIYLFKFNGVDRGYYLYRNFNNVIMPINYIIASHLSFYALIMAVYFSIKHHDWSNEKRLYLSTIIIIFIITAVVESYLTVYAESYRWFIYYYLITSSLVIFVAYVMYFKPEVFKNISRKYYSSGLSLKDKKRIADKINLFITEDENIVNTELNLKILCDSINEKQHHVSQTISEELKTNFKDLINNKRIEFAKKLLFKKENLNMKLFAVALESGFTNKSTFHRVFVKFEGCTPNEFRKKSLI